jgi:hypothetical protein
MGGTDVIEEQARAMVEEEAAGADLLRPLVQAPLAMPPHAASSGGIVIGELVAMKDQGKMPLVLFSGQPGTAALAARTVVDLHMPHIGSKVALMFEGADLNKPVIIGVLQEGRGWPLTERPGQVKMDADGGRLIVSAKERMVLRCGNASITLTKAGNVLIEGSYLLSRSSGVNRIKGGSIQLN